jgi:hypothetical protein
MPAASSPESDEAARQRKRRRRPRGERRVDSNSTTQQTVGTDGSAATQGAEATPLFTRIKLKIKSWVQRLPLPRGRR